MEVMRARDADELVPTLPAIVIDGPVSRTTAWSELPSASKK